MVFEWSAYNNDILVSNTPNNRTGVPKYDKEYKRDYYQRRKGEKVKGNDPAPDQRKRKRFAKQEVKPKMMPHVYRVPEDLYEMMGVIVEILDMTLEDYVNNNRQRRYVRLRCIATAILRKYYSIPLAELARIYGHKDHTSVLHYVSLHPQTLLSNDQVYMNEYYKCLNAVKAWMDKK